MRRNGLVAKRECYCEHCSEEMMLEAVRRGMGKQKEVRGFVHLGEWDRASSLEEFLVPLVFGSVTDGKPAYGGGGCLQVGEIVSRCLKEQGIRHDWNRTPGNPILVKVDHALSGVPMGGGHRAIPLTEDHRAFRVPNVPESAFDRIEGNPLRLVNLAKVRRLGLDLPKLFGPVQRPSIGDHVKLGFLIRDAVAPLARKECGDMVDWMQLESMWVEVTGVERERPERVYRGELLNVPLFIDPAELRIGSPVNFTAEHVYPVEDESRGRVRR
jgi:hypothetical protein